MASFEGAKSVGANRVCIQEPYVSGGVLSHLAFDIRWGTVGKRKEQTVAIGKVVSTRGRLIVEARTNIIDHSYIMVLDLWELEKPGGKKNRKTRVANTYENNLTAHQV